MIFDVCKFFNVKPCEILYYHSKMYTPYIGELYKITGQPGHYKLTPVTANELGTLIVNKDTVNYPKDVNAILLCKASKAYTWVTDIVMKYFKDFEGVPVPSPTPRGDLKPYTCIKSHPSSAVMEIYINSVELSDYPTIIHDIVHVGVNYDKGTGKYTEDQIISNMYRVGLEDGEYHFHTPKDAISALELYHEGVELLY